MNKNFELIKTGIDDNISILSEDQLDEIVGGNFVCKKNFATRNKRERFWHRNNRFVNGWSSRYKPQNKLN